MMTFTNWSTKGAAFALAGALAAPAVAGDKIYEGVTINVLSRPGPVISEPLQRRGKEFEEMTGAKVNVSSVPVSDLYQKLLTDWAIGTNSIDVGVYAAGWGVDFVNGGYLENLDDYIAKDDKIQFDDIAPFFRDYNQKVDGSTYMLTLDGDFHVLYYRKDVLEDLGLTPPTTWDEYLEVAKAAHGKDHNGDGTPDFGSCFPKKRAAQMSFYFNSVAAAFLQSQGTSQGIYFDTETMDPLYGPNDAFVRALEVFKATGDYGPADELNMDIGGSRGAFLSGRCALLVEWGDVGVSASETENSSVVDLVGVTKLPGSRQVLDRASGTLVECTDAICPHAEDGVNHAPFAAWGGWVAGINANADPKVKEAAYAYLSYMSAPEQSGVDVTIGITGFDPYRFSQLESDEHWVKAGFSPDYAADYLGAIRSSLNSPNLAVELKIAGNQQYIYDILDRELSRYLAGETDANQAAKNISAGWQEVTEDNGTEDQLAGYRQTLGIRN